MAENRTYKCYILFPDQMNEKITWPDSWQRTCRANLAPMLRELLGVKGIGSEIKLIWNDTHRRIILESNKVSYQQLEDYLKADTDMLSFHSKRTRERAVDALTKMGATNLVCVDDYRDVIIYQAYFKNHGKFPDGSPSDKTQ